MPLLKNCCIFFDLKVGSKIIGILSLILGIITTLMFAGFVVMFGFVDAGARNINTAIDEHRASLNPDDDYTDANEEASLDFIQTVMSHLSSVASVTYVILALCILCIITASCLIHGIKHNRRGLLIPYIVQQVLNVITYASLDIWALVVLGTQKGVVGVVLSLLAFMVVHLYFAIVVFSQYQALGLIRMHEDISMK